jgi:hypothetical protein
MNKFKMFAFVALVLVLVVTACGGGGGPSTEPTAGPSATSDTSAGIEATSPEATAETVAEVTEPTLEPAVEETPTLAAEENLNLGSVSEGLAQLKSYKSKLDMRFTGKDAQGQAVDTSWSMAEDFILEPRAQRILWTGSESKGGQPATTTSWETISVGGSSYMISRDESGTETCVSMTSAESEAPTQALSPDMWGSISDANYVNTETVNGVRAKHYAWKEGAFSTLGLGSGKGDTWVAVDGGYVVKQVIEATGKGIFMAGTDEEGTTTWEWNLTDANGNFEILPPANCESAAQDIPVMADATEKATFGDMLSYTSASALADVVNFYKAEMPNAGWQPTGEPTETPDFAMLEFTKDGSTASVMASYDSSAQKTSVVITVTKQ